MDNRSGMSWSYSQPVISPFIFYSGNAETPTAASWPSVPFLVKPLLATQVVDMLARVVATKRGKPSQAQKGDPLSQQN
jgi:hypothetical protein